MTTIRTMQIMLLGLLLPIISFAQQDVYAQHELSKDTIEITISNNDKIIFIADSLDVFDKVNIDSLFQTVKQGMGGNFTNTSDKHITKSFTLDSIPNSTVKPKSSNWFSGRNLYLEVDFLAGLIKNELSPGLSFMLALSPSEKGPIGGFLSADMYYFFPKNSLGKTTIDINTFVNAGLLFNESRLYVGAGMGFGKQFEKPAFKLFTGHKLYPFVICPELYIVDGFKKAYPGITLRVHF